MANRRWTSNDQLRQRPDSGSRPSPGVGGRKAARSDRESAVPYPGAPGPKGKGWNPQRLGFHEVKTRVKQDLADDIYGNSPGILGPPIRFGPGFNPPAPDVPVAGVSPMPGTVPSFRRPMGINGRLFRRRNGGGKLY